MTVLSLYSPLLHSKQVVDVKLQVRHIGLQTEHNKL